jgi:hypothetical protein
MKSKRKTVLRVIFLSALVFSLSGCASLISFPIRDIVGVWEGSYTAGQGETGVTFTVYQEGSGVKGMFKFYNLPGRNNAAEGSYYMNGSYDSETKTHTFRGYEWIVHPENYGFADIQGTVSGGVYSGTVLPNIGTFRMVKKSQ